MPDEVRHFGSIVRHAEETSQRAGRGHRFVVTHRDPGSLSVMEASSSAQLRREGRQDGPVNDEPRSPKDTFITVYGRMPVLEVLQDLELSVDKVVLAESAHGESVDRIRTLARRRGIPVRTATAHRVKVLAGNGKHDQGVLADVVAPRMTLVEDFVQRPSEGGDAVLVLDAVTNPQNVGMILRTATAAGLGGVVLPARVARCGPARRQGVRRRRLPGADPARAALRLRRCGRSRTPGGGSPGWTAALRTTSTRPSCRRRRRSCSATRPRVCRRRSPSLVDVWVSIPMAGGVESLNVASAAAVVSFELLRRRLAATGLEIDRP